MADPPEETSQPPPADETPEPAPGAEGAAAGAPASWRRWMPRRRAAAEDSSPGAQAAQDGDGPAEEPTEVIPPPPRPEGPGRLRRERRRLLGEREEAVYNLGGLAFELYRRDLLGEEVMQRRAGEVAMLDDTVRDIDARLGEIDRDRRERRRRRGARDDAAGNCLACRAPFRAEARFCWQCGSPLVPTSEGDDQVTAVITPPAPPAADPDAPPPPGQT